MKIDSIQLTNYRCHRDLFVEFRARFTVIVAVNGGGKTSLLRALTDALSDVVLQITGSSHGGLDTLPSPARIEANKDGGRYRFEEMYPVTLDVSATDSTEANLSWSVTKHNAVGASALAANDRYTSHVRGLRSADSSGSLPVFAFYRATRQWLLANANHIQAALQRSARTDAYLSWSDASQDASLAVWIIARCLERTQSAVDAGTSFEDVDDDELALLNTALRSVLEGFTTLRYDMKRSSLLVEWDAAQDKSPTSFENMSDGQRSVVFLVADIARRICLLNPHLGPQALQATRGVVLIDELDLHLHPHWQRVLARGLKDAFPGVQFIAATHSPQILGELQPEEIVVLQRSGFTQPQVSYGLTSSQVLQDIMGAEIRTPKIERGLEEIFALIEGGDFVGASSRIDAISRVADGLPELERARSMLQRRELLGR